MGPSKRKGSVRRPVLDLNAKDDSPSRPTWQTKYQQVLATEDVQENGDTQISQSNKNPLFGLLGNYQSDSDNDEAVVRSSDTTLDAKVEDFLKEIHSISTETINNAQKEEQISVSQIQNQKNNEETSYPSSVTAWQQCYDYNSGYPYYWNTETNEVTWEMPAELKAALTNVAKKQQQYQIQQQEKLNLTTQQPPKEKKKPKYPWQTESDSEDEKIEMITSFGPPSDDELDEKVKKTKIEKVEKKQSSKKIIGPQYLVSSSGLCIDPSKIKSDTISCAPEDSEGMNETSSLLTHCVQDTGPPGDDTFQAHKGLFSKKNLATSSLKKESSNIALKSENTVYSNKTSNPTIKNDSVTKVVSNQDNINQNIEEHSGEKTMEAKNADDVIAQIEKESPPDYQKVQDNVTDQDVLQSQEILSQANAKPSGISLIANYSDDSEVEDNNLSEKKQENIKPVTKTSSTPLFPVESSLNKGEKIKPLFPCMDTEVSPKVSIPESLLPKEPTDEELLETANKVYNVELNDGSDTSNHKAFKRKKRLEFATTAYGTSTSKSLEMKSNSPERAVGVYNSQYNMDPSMNEYRGFGFSSLRNETDSERITYKNYGGINFIKAETINLSTPTKPQEKKESETQTSDVFVKSEKELELDKEIEETAVLLREKVTFLTGGTTQIPPIQYMAIELETLVLAWQQGALTPPYLLRWLKEKCTELIRHEKSAAPSGWTCLWDRKNKRYYYRNSVTKATQWDYPNVEEKIKGKDDVVGEGDEMDICDTPPHMSPSGSEKPTDVQPSTPPPPPVIANTSENVSPTSPTPQPPPPPQISYCPENESSIVKTAKKKKRKHENSQINEADANESKTPAILSSFDQTAEMNEVAPPLPPMPPPPPPPPDESPPPLPDSPPPLPLDPEQPLPPGVDEPEYTLYRKVSPKHPYKKTSAESSAYSAELMMSYGYGYSSNGQPITMPMQPLEYHTYVHDSVSNTYLVQSAPTSHVIQCSAKKSKISLNSELVSFYSDLAMLDASPSENFNTETQVTSSTASSAQDLNVSTTKTTITTTTPTTATTTGVTTATTSFLAVSSSPTIQSKTTNSVTSNGFNSKKKKKPKSTKSGLSLKKKGVSSLVAKWQQVQQEVRRDFSDDDENDTH